MKTQEQMYWESHRKISDRNNAVMEMINCKSNPLTKEDLHELADRFPERWETYRNLLD